VAGQDAQESGNTVIETDTRTERTNNFLLQKNPFRLPKKSQAGAATTQTRGIQS